MTINRRRAPSSKISSEKKLGGHKQEALYAEMIQGEVILGTQKGDVRDQNNKLHSVKSGKKWQVFLYSPNRIAKSGFLKILQPCQEAFPEDSKQYFVDRAICIAFKEKRVADYGKEKTKLLPNNVVIENIDRNTYIESKNALQKTTALVCEALKDKKTLRDFLNEALFNNREVSFFAIKDETYLKDGIFKVFSRSYVLDTLSKELVPDISSAGKVPEDFNVGGQKTLLRYEKTPGKLKNIVEIEIRNDSPTKYRQVRFNMYSHDVLHLLLKNSPPSKVIQNTSVVLYGEAVNLFEMS